MFYAGVMRNLRSVKKPGGGGFEQNVDEQTVGDAGDEIPDIFRAGERRHGVAKGLVGFAVGNGRGFASSDGGLPGVLHGVAAAKDAWIHGQVFVGFRGWDRTYDRRLSRHGISMGPGQAGG